jgi:hypothetical protein
MKKLFKKKHPRKIHYILFVLMALFLITSGLVLRNIKLSGEELGAAALYAQVTPTPPVEDRSEVGSTDGIVLMGVIIVLIVVVPILLQRKSWSSD